MAGTVATDLAFFSAANDSSCDSTGVWAGYTLTLDTETMVQGTGCCSFKLNVTTTVSAAVVFTPTSSVDMSSKYMYFWTMGLRLSQWETKANGGVRAYFYDGTNWAEWFVNGKDTMPGGWVPQCARPADTVDAGIEQYGGTPTYVDQTTECNNNTASDVYPMCTAGQGTPATGDCFYIGKTMPFKRIIWKVATALSGTSTVTYKYWDGSAWTALSSVTDRTTNFTVTGTNRVEYTLPTDWRPTTINSQGPFYYIKAEWTIGTYTTRPLCSRAWVRFGKDPDRSDVIANTGDTNANKECDWGTITKIGWRCKLAIGATKVNTFFDAFRYGSYVQLTGGSAGGSEASLSDFMTDGTYGEDTAKLGVFEKINGVYYLQGNVYLGSSGTASTVFLEQNSHVRIKNNDSVGSHVMGFDLLSNSTAATAVTFGALTTSGGKNLTSGGLLIDTDGPYYIFNVTQTKSTDTPYIYGTKFKGCSRFRVGTTATTASYWKLINNKFEGCNTIRINDGGNSVFDQNSVASALTTPSLNVVEMYALNSGSTWTDNAFINNSGTGQNALVFKASGTFTMKRNLTANNTCDYYMDHPSGTVTLNLVDSTDDPTLGPTSSNSLSYDVYEKTTWDLTVQDDAAADIDDAGVRLTDTGGTEQVLTRTTSGDIAQQQVKRRTSEHSSGLPKGAPTETVHNPYNLRVRKYGYLPMEISGKVFGISAIADSFVMTDDTYAVDTEATVEAWTNIDIDRTWTPTRTTLTSTEYGTLAFSGTSITRTSGDWTDTSPETDNYSVKGTNITISGSDSNDGTYHVVSATALVLTVLETLVTETASADETVTGWRPYQIGIGSSSPNRSINDVYEFMRWLTSQTTTPGNYMNIADPIVTADGTTYVIEWYNFDVDTITLTGTGKNLSMPEKDFTLTNGGAHGLTVVQDIDGSSVSLTVTCLDDLANPVYDARVRIEKASDNSLIANGYTDEDGLYSTAYTYTADLDVNIIARLKGYLPYSGVSTITASGLSVPANMPVDEAIDLP